MNALLSAVRVSAGYGERRVVDEVSLEVRPGELWAVLGPNGAGKSTFLRAVLGLHALSGGSVELGGRKVAELDPSERARYVAWVPQDFEAEGGFSGLELVLMGRAPYLSRFGLPSAEDVARARACLTELGIAHLAARSSTAMSGGERRLLLLARALVQTPRLLLLDEPTAFLDLKHQVDALARVRARLGPEFGAVAVLHDLNLAAAFADRVLLLREGRVLAQGPTAEVLEPKRLEALYQVPIAFGRSDAGQPLFAPRPS